MNVRALIRRLRGSVAAPPASGAYVYQPATSSQTYDEAVDALAARGLDARRGEVPWLDDAALDALAAEVRALGVPVEDFVADPAEFARYAEAAQYQRRYPGYYSDNRAEKTFEHFLAFKVLAPAPGERIVDLASEHSPVPEIYGRLSGAECYAQDIQYPSGLNGRTIGGDACAMPVPGGFARAATLTCSLEHFEGDGDTRLIAEMARVLAPGGRLVVAPLYMSDHDATQTDPLYSAAADVAFDAGTTVYCKPGWGNRHGRFYSPRSLLERVVAPQRERLDFRIHRLRNAAELPAGIYLRLFMVCTRR